MADFPTLSRKPDSDGWTEGPAYDPTIRSQMESGAQVTRPRFTGAVKQWSFTYRYLTAADKALLEVFERDTVRYGSLVFSWINPYDDKIYQVRFGELLRFRLDDDHQTWQLAVVLVEAYPNSGQEQE